MAAEAKVQPADPPVPLRGRKVWVQLNNMNTVVIPHDPEDASSDPWFADQIDPAGQSVPTVQAGNEVVYFVDGKETFEQFIYEIQNTGPGDFIYLLGWILFLDFDLWVDRPVFTLVGASSEGMKTVDPQSLPWFGTTMRQMLTAADLRGVQIRTMLPENAGGFGETLENTFKLGNNSSVSKWISSLSNGAGILDERTLLEGTHHQKILVVKRGDLLTAFCGGVDINPDRVQATGHGAPLHDVHCRIRGPAASDLLKIFMERWDDYVGGIRAADEERRYLTRVPELLGKSMNASHRFGNLSVQVARTYGRGRTFSYDFAPQGERSIMALITKAIQSSKRFIYFEDQYLVSMYIAGLLRDKLKDLRHVTILVSPAKYCDLPEGIYRRKLFIEELRKGGGDKVRIFSPTKPCESCGTYVHAKTWIFDDKFAIIGSANCNRRGLTHDSEASVGIFDASDDSRLTYCFAHRLRIKLWAHHLGIDNAEGHAELADGVGCADNWLGAFRPDSARIDDYDTPFSMGGVNNDFSWNHAFDCDGS